MRPGGRPVGENSYIQRVAGPLKYWRTPASSGHYVGYSPVLFDTIIVSLLDALGVSQMRSESRNFGRASILCSFASVLFALSVFVQGTALAEPIGEDEKYNHMLDDRFSLWIGGFFPNVESEIRLDNVVAGGPGDTISFENFLGLEDSKTTLWGGFRWRISRRNKLEFEFNNLNRSGHVEASTKDIAIGEQIIRGTAKIDTQFDLTLGRLTYGFSVIRKQKHDFAVKAGFHIAGASLKIDAFGQVENINTGEVISGQAVPVETDEYTLPLPHLGLSYTYAFTPKWGLRAQAIGFALKINDIKGAMAEIDLDLHYQRWKYVGIGGGFRYWDLSVEDTGDSFLTGEFEYKYWGPALYVLGSF
jgi:hypothetical protein